MKLTTAHIAAAGASGGGLSGKMIKSSALHPTSRSDTERHLARGSAPQPAARNQHDRTTVNAW